MKLLLGLLLASFVALGFTYAAVTPLFEASDELWHYPMVQQLADGQGLPVQDPVNVGPWRQEGSQPPLYYAVAALATTGIDTRDVDEVRWLNPHVDNGVITPDGNINLAVHTAAERFPWRGTALAVRLIRFLSVLMSAGTVCFTYLLAREIIPNRPRLALAAAAVVAFTPMFLFISGSVNNDNLAVPLSAAALWLFARLSTSPQPLTPNPQSPLLTFKGPPFIGPLFTRTARQWGSVVHCSLGVLLGLAALTKESTLGLFPLAAAVLAYNAFRRWQGERRKMHAPWPEVKAANGHTHTAPSTPSWFTRTARQSGTVVHSSPALPGSGAVVFIVQFLLVFGPAFLISGWWYWRNLVLYGDFLGLNVFVKILGQRAAPASLAQLWSERAGFMQSYWGLFGGVNVPMPGWIYTLLNAVAVLSAIGLGVHLVRKFHADRFSLAAWPATLLALGWVAAVIASLVRWATVTWSSQGRLVFSAISAISTLLILGLAALIPRRAQPYFFGTLIAFLVGISAIAPFAWIAPKYVDPPPLTQAQIGAISHRLDADFGGKMTLLGYDLESAAVHPGETLSVTLYWRAQTAMDRDWSVFVHLLDENKIVVAQRDTYPGLGLLPTRRIAPGQTLADRYVIHAPAGTYAPSSARVVAGLSDFNTGERLPITNCDAAGGQDASCGLSSSLTLSPISIVANPGEIPNPLSLNFGDQIELAGYQLDRRAAQPGQTINLTLYWRARKPISKNYSVFTHIRGEGQSLWAQKDSWPQNGAAPTATWQAGRLVEDTYDLTLKPDTPAGVYDIEIGLYDAAGNRLQLVTPDGRLADNFAYLAKVRVARP